MTNYSVEDLERLWNEQDDPLNTWDELGLDEIVAFAQKVTRQWQPIKTAPKDGTAIVAWVNHNSDPYFEPGTDGEYLTTYGAHAEGLGHATDGLHIVQWGGEYYEEGYKIPCYWFVQGTDWECPANPTHWMPLPDTPQ